MLDIRALQLLSLCCCTCAHSSARPLPKPANSFVDEKDPSSSLNKSYFLRSRCCHRRPEAFVGEISCWPLGLWQCLFKNHADNGANLAHLLEDILGNILFSHSDDKHVFVYWFFLTFCFVGSWLKQLLYSETSNLAFSKCFFFFERETSCQIFNWWMCLPFIYCWAFFFPIKGCYFLKLAFNSCFNWGKTNFSSDSIRPQWNLCAELSQKQTHPTDLCRSWDCRQKTLNIFYSSQVEFFFFNAFGHYFHYRWTLLNGFLLMTWHLVFSVCLKQ